MKTIQTTAKATMIEAATKALEAKEMATGIQDQMNAESLREVIEELKALNLVQAFKLYRAICKHEADCLATCEKYGFTYRPLSPINWMQFAN